MHQTMLAGDRTWPAAGDGGAVTRDSDSASRDREGESPAATCETREG
jgi:hypothetical protein